MTHPPTSETRVSRTAAATRARMRNHEERLATELRQRGWTVTPPADYAPDRPAPADIDLVALIRPWPPKGAPIGCRVVICGPPCAGSRPRANLDGLGEHEQEAIMLTGHPVPRRPDSAVQVGPFVELLDAHGYAVAGAWITGRDSAYRPYARVTVRRVSP